MPDGKVVWFVFDLGRRRARAGRVPPRARLGVPLDVHRRNSEHGEALRRELAFVDQRRRTPTAHRSACTRSGCELTARYGGLTVVQENRLSEALAAGEATVDLEYDLPIEMADGIERLGAPVRRARRLLPRG